MWPTRQASICAIYNNLLSYSARSLPGVTQDECRIALSLQMVASLRRLDYTKIRLQRDISNLRTDPSSALFDPEMAAIWHMRQGNIDEAFWLIFLSINFGKHPTHGWKRLKDVYSGLGKMRWDWNRISADPATFRMWLSQHWTEVGGAFGNHRKYETLKPQSNRGTAAVFESYVAWVGHSHQHLIGRLVRQGGNNPQNIFDIHGVRRIPKKALHVDS